MVRSPLDLIRGDVKVSTLPMIFVRINETVNNPCSSVLDIGEVISEDQGLTARLLRIANSPVYGFPSKIETITQAVLVIGTQQIRDLALATSVIQLFEGIGEDIISMNSFWHHAVACGVIARILAGYRREPNVERFFIAGILHDIGRLIMLTRIKEAAREIFLRARGEKEVLYRVEREVLGFDHSDVGGALLKEWKLPASLTESVANHHNPMHAVQFPGETAAIHIADIIAHALQKGNSGNRFVPPLNESAWEGIRLPLGILTPLLMQVEEQFDAAVKFVCPVKQK